MKLKSSRSNSATSNRPSKWSNATHNNNKRCRRGSSRRARIRRLSRRSKSLNNPLAAGRMRTPEKSWLEAGAPKRARRVVPLHGREHRAELSSGEIFQGAQARRVRPTSGAPGGKACAENPGTDGRPCACCIRDRGRTFRSDITRAFASRL